MTEALGMDKNPEKQGLFRPPFALRIFANLEGMIPALNQSVFLQPPKGEVVGVKAWALQGRGPVIPFVDEMPARSFSE